MDRLIFFGARANFEWLSGKHTMSAEDTCQCGKLGAVTRIEMHADPHIFTVGAAAMNAAHRAMMSTIDAGCTDCMRVVAAAGRYRLSDGGIGPMLRALDTENRVSVIRTLVAYGARPFAGRPLPLRWHRPNSRNNTMVAAACSLTCFSSDEQANLTKWAIQLSAGTTVQEFAGIDIVPNQALRWNLIWSCVGFTRMDKKHTRFPESDPAGVADAQLRLGEFPPEWDEKDCPLAHLLHRCRTRSPDEEAMIHVLRKHKNCRARELLPGNELELPSDAVADILQWIG